MNISFFTKPLLLLIFISSFSVESYAIGTPEKNTKRKVLSDSLGRKYSRYNSKNEISLRRAEEKQPRRLVFDDVGVPSDSSLSASISGNLEALEELKELRKNALNALHESNARGGNDPSSDDKKAQEEEKESEAAAPSSFSTPPTQRNKAAQLKAFIKQMQFQHGDFLFGLQTEREGIRSHLVEQKRYGAVTVDQFNNKCLGEIQLDMVDRPERLSKLVSDLIKREENPVSVDDRERLSRFIRYLILNYDDSSSPLASFENSTLAQVCKIAIQFAQAEGKKIHFVLDGLDMEKVLEETSVNYNSFTSQELRHVYLLWKKDPKILDTVIFYHNYQEVLAPWLENDPSVRLPWNTVH